eukprot:NODE_58_length_28395_cov_1.465720.p22 type:complete len:168 gc:universal NODE_58_length_28395_cov_1.465720:4027-3524(-)
MHDFDLPKFEVIQSNYMQLKLEKAQTSKVRKIRDKIVMLERQAVSLNEEYQNLLDLHLGQKNINIVKQINALDINSVENHLKEEFNDRFGVNLPYNVDLLEFKSNLLKLQETLTQKIEKYEESELDNLKQAEDTITRHRLKASLEKKINILQNLQNIEKLIQKCRLT